MKIRLFAVVAVVSLTGVATLVVATFWPSPPCPSVGSPVAPLPASVQGRLWPDDHLDFVGHTEKDIRQRYGPPSRRFTGHFGLPGVDWEHIDAITVEYQLPSGVRYITYCWQGGESVCLRSAWLPAGSAF